jgi:hypothetical protein
LKRALIGAALALLALVIAWSVWRWAVEEEAPHAVSVELQSLDADESGSSDEPSTSLATDVRTSRYDSKSSAAADARVSAMRPTAPITLFGRVKNIVAPDSTVPELEIKLVIAGRMHRARVGRGEDYRISGLPPGRARVRIEVRGFRPLVEEHDLRAEPLEQKLNFYLVPQDSIDLRVVASDGRPLLEALQSDGTFAAPPEITIVATREEPGAVLPFIDGPAYSGYASGRVVLTLKPRGWENAYEYARTLELGGEPPVYLSACRSSAVLATRYVPSPSGDVVLPIELDALRACAGSAHLRIVALEDERLLDDASARLDVVRDTRGGRMEPSLRMHGAADDLPRTGGDVTVRDLDPGAYTLTMSAPGRERLRVRTRVGPGVVTDLGTYRLARAAAIEGDVVDASGPVARAHVVLIPIVGGEGDANGVAVESVADAEGRFRFEGLGERSYVLRAHGAETVARPAVVDASRGDVALRVVLEPGTLVLLRLDPSFAVQPGASSEHSIAVFDERHKLVAQSAMSDGVAQFRLIRGSYTFEVARRGTPIVHGTFEIGGETMDVNITR